MIDESPCCGHIYELILAHNLSQRNVIDKILPFHYFTFMVNIKEQTTITNGHKTKNVKQNDFICNSLLMIFLFSN